MTRRKNLSPTTPVDQLALSEQAQKRLHQANIETVAELTNIHHDTLVAIPGLTALTIAEIWDTLVLGGIKPRWTIQTRHIRYGARRRRAVPTGQWECEACYNKPTGTDLESLAQHMRQHHGDPGHEVTNMLRFRIETGNQDVQIRELEFDGDWSVPAR